MFDIKSYLADKSKTINKALEKRLLPENTRPAVLHRAMRYSVLGGGKRLRPVLCLAAAEAIGGEKNAALIPALAIEILHTYTLVHDDLPAMDNDALRRGKPTSHVVFGEANAILAGDALLALAFEWIAEIAPPPPYAPNRLIIELARAAGSQGVVGGQVADLAAEGINPNAAAVDFIHRHKTADLITAAARIGAICAGAGQSELAAISIYGCKAGLAFQITDDILNETSSSENIGKAAGSDRERGKMTYVAAHGLEKARKQARKLAVQAGNSLTALQGDIKPLAGLIEYIVDRKF